MCNNLIIVWISTLVFAFGVFSWLIGYYYNRKAEKLYDENYILMLENRNLLGRVIRTINDIQH